MIHRIRINLPKGWESSAPGIADMIFVNEEDAKNHAEKFSWEARNHTCTLHIQWEGYEGVYICKIDNKNGSQEIKKLSFPHEVIDWITEHVQ